MFRSDHRGEAASSTSSNQIQDDAATWPSAEPERPTLVLGTTTRGILEAACARLASSAYLLRRENPNVSLPRVVRVSFKTVDREGLLSTRIILLSDP